MTTMTFADQGTARHVAHLRGEDDRTVCGAVWQGWQLNVPRLMRLRADGERALPPHLPPKPKDEIHKCQACYPRHAR